MSKASAVKTTRAPKKVVKRKSAARKSAARKSKVVRIDMKWADMYGWGNKSAGEDVEELLHMSFAAPDMTNHVVRKTKIARGAKAAEGSATIREWVGKKISEGAYTRAQIIAQFKLAYPHANQTQGGRYITSAFNDTYCYKRWGKKAVKSDKGVISWATK